MLGTIPEIQNGIYQRFANNRVLLILDNFETITDEKNVKDFIEGLAFEAPRTKVVISSRKSSEMLYHIPVPELNKNQTFDLIDNLLSNSLCSTDTPTQELKNTIYETTGGVPLAIKIIMGMISTEHKYQYSKKQLFNKLEGKSGEGVLPFIFAESIGRLNKNNTYGILLATAMFPKKPFTLETIAEIAGMSDISKDDIIDCLDELNCMQLVSPKKGRYSMLSLTQSYCLKELKSNSDMEREYYERRFSFYRRFVEKHCAYKKNNIERIKNYDKVDKEWDNILAIIMWCKDKNYYEMVKELWFLVNNYANLRGHWRERLTWLEYILSNSKSLGESKYAARSQMNMARILLLQGTQQKLYEAETLLKDAWKKRGKLDATDIDYITNHFAGLYLRLGNYQEAHKWLEVEQNNLNESNNINNSDRIRYQLYINRESADVLFHEGKYNEAKQLCFQIIEDNRFTTHIRSINYVRRILAEIYIIEGDTDKARQQLDLGFEEVQSNDDKRRIGYYNASFARLAIKLGDASSSMDDKKTHYDEAEKYASIAMSKFCDLGMERNHIKVKDEIIGAIKENRQRLKC